VIVRAKNIPELDAAPRTVGPDGNVTFNLIGAVPVANLTPDELAAQLTKVMSRYYKDPDIKVEVVANSKFIYVMGPGFAQSSLKIGYTGRNTVVSAIADAGIQYDTAWPEQVTLNRPNKDPAREARITIDFTKFYEEGSLKQNFLLEEGDVIHMRHDNLTKISLGMQKVLGPLTGASTISSTGGTLVKPSGTK
jgi:polysaccharide export outer membrane protein